MIILKICNRVIEYSFYSLFLLVPLAFTSKTSELFEMNKMWLTWGLTIIIVSSWLIKMVLQKRILFRRTPLDIPIGLFLLSQIISTIFSLDTHVSFWGYYSRFNGGLFSTVSYIFLYYAFLSNFDSQKLSAITHKLLAISLVSGLIVALWGLPSHFGYDPTCLLFRGTLDVSCWTADFMPRARIFSTLGQPAWLAAYLAILIPIAIAFFLKKRNSLILNHLSLIIILLFYVDLLYTRTRSGFLGIWVALISFFGIYFWLQRKNLNIPAKPWRSGKSLIINHSSFIIIGLLLITFIIGVPIPQLSGLTLEGISRNIQKIQAPKTSQKPLPMETGEPTRITPQSVAGGTESADIRRYVWAGAINAWKANPLIGTGVETFAFAYYKYKPAGQNLTSEWNFLYNKAHNEYLNYLATTGLLGLGTYLAMIGFFLTIVMLNLFQHLNASKDETLKQVQGDNNKTLNFALVASYISILITNFFGFSVVITNIYLFMIPAFVFVLSNMIKDESNDQRLKTNDQNQNASIWQWTPIFFILLACLFSLITLFRFWQADVAFALGYNLDRAGEYQQAYPHLHKAVKIRGGEPVFKDELSINNAILATALIAQKPQDEKAQEQIIKDASSLAQQAINVSNDIISGYQNNTVFWKTRTKLFYTLSQVDSRYLPRALDAITKAYALAPNDANILYNLGILYGQNNNLAKGIEALEKTIKLKPDYRDAHYALGLFYNEAGKKDKAIEQMQYILGNISPQDAGAKESIKSWTIDK